MGPFPSRRMAVFSGLAGLVVLVPMRPIAAAELSAKDFVAAIYRTYVSKSGKGRNGISIGSDAAIRRYFSPAAAALIVADARQVRKRDEVPALDGDPFVGHQDWEITAVAVDIAENGPAANGTVTLTNLGKPEKISVALIKTPSGGRFDDVVWTEGSLRGLYKKP